MHISSFMCLFCTHRADHVMVVWGRVADYAQRGMVVVLAGLSVYGIAIMARGGWKAKQRKNNALKEASKSRETISS